MASATWSWNGLKKNCSLTHSQKLSLIDKDHPAIGLARQAALLDVSRSSLYYIPKINEKDEQIMNLIDKIYTELPFYGSRRIRDELKETYGIPIGREHTQSLMRLMGIEAVYPKKRFNLSQNNAPHKIYPYLLRDYSITESNQVWGTDITYIRLEKGWAYLTALLDWFSRYVISWELSETLEADFCVSNLERALEIGRPLIHNSDQGTQYTDQDYLKILEDKQIKISMDGRGRFADNIFTERLWRTVKYENVFLKSYYDIRDAREGLNDYFRFYNSRRRHQALDNQTPESVYRRGQ